jgi:general secretion pathway protein H
VIAGASTPRRTRVRGFTLLELMVVVVIIGLVVAGAILSLGATGRDRQLEQERDRLSALMSYVRERASILTLEYGLRCGEHGYRFTYFDNRTNQWLPETTDDGLRLRNLPSGLTLKLVIEGREVVLNDKALTINPAATTAPGGLAPSLGTYSAQSTLNTQIADNTPQIMLLSNGDTNSFALTIARDSEQRSATLQSNTDGTVQVGDVTQAPR